MPKTVSAEAHLRARNQITIPDSIVRAVGIEPGETFVVEVEPDDAPCAHHRHGVERRDPDRSRERREVGGQPLGKSERQRQIQMRCRPLLAGVEACKINEFDVLAGTCL
jgi:bifunctional DNA-binding transcriptional regulator/antitoxin component of YhaV-PrlF toxin-antitoxin module